MFLCFTVDHQLSQGNPQVSATTYFSLRLGPYDSQNAVQTLPNQLDLLHTFRDEFPPESALIYRLQTVADGDDDMAAIFSVMCAGKSRAVVGEAEWQSLLNQAAVTLNSGWHLTLLDGAPALPPAQVRYRIGPTDSSATIPVKPDWAQLVDLLRRRQQEVVVDLVCSPVDTAGLDDGQRAHLGDVHHHFDMGAPGELHAQQFFCGISADVLRRPRRRRKLALGVVVHSDAVLDGVFLSQVGRILLGLSTGHQRVSRNVLFPRDMSDAVVDDPEIIIRVLHPPYGHIEGRGLEGRGETSIPIKFPVPKIPDATNLGRAVRQRSIADKEVEIGLSPADRRKHIYMIGKTGSGKTNFLKNLVRQDIARGHGVAIIDPHGPLVDYALAHCSSRESDVVLLDFSDEEYVPAFNPLLIDDETRSHSIITEEILDVLVRKTFNQFAGPVFEDTVSMVVATILSPELRRLVEPSLPVALETLRDPNARRWLAGNLTSSHELAGEWEVFGAMSGTNIAESKRWVLAKFAEFAREGYLYRATGAGRSPLSFQEIFDEGKILLVKIPETSVGPRAAGILGSLIFSRLHHAARQGSRVEGDPFMVYLDEFQKFVDVEVEEMIAEARKFGLALTLAHQNTRQLDAFSTHEGTANARLREAIFSNAGTVVCLKASGSDVPLIAAELGVTERAVRRLSQFDALVRPVIDGSERYPFVVMTDHADQHSGDPSVAERVADRMRATGITLSADDLFAGVESARQKLRALWKKPARAASDEAESDFLASWARKRHGKRGGGDGEPDRARRTSDASREGASNQADKRASAPGSGND